MKKAILPLVILTSLLASCGQQAFTPQATNDTTTSVESIQAQAIGPCTTYVNYGPPAPACSSSQLDLVNRAGNLFTNSGLSGGEKNMTIGVTKYQGSYYASMFYDPAYPNALTKIRAAASRAGYGWVPPQNYVHAEQRLYNSFGNQISQIGISNPNGPCGTCQANVGNKGISISWIPGKYW